MSAKGARTRMKDPPANPVIAKTRRDACYATISNKRLGRSAKKVNQLTVVVLEQQGNALTRG